MKRTPLFEEGGERAIDQQKLERAAARSLGLEYSEDIRSRKVQGNYLWVGHTDIKESVDALDAVVAAYDAPADDFPLYSFAAFCEVCKRLPSIRGKIEQHEKAIEQWEYQDARRVQRNWSNQWKEGGTYEHARPVPKLYVTEQEGLFAASDEVWHFTTDASGYLNYIGTFANDLWLVITDIKLEVWLKSGNGNPHSYILGTTGSGKTELMKLALHNVVERPEYGSAVLLDPAGEFAEQVGRWKEFAGSNRLIYLKPNLGRGQSPTINPFEIEGIDVNDYSQEALDIKEVVRQELVQGLGQMISERGAGSAITLPMQVILQRCLQVLLDRKGSTLEDLQRFMIDDGDRNADLIAYAKKLPHHLGLGEFFEDGFQGNKVTKESIYRKLDALLANRAFRRFTCGKSTVSLQRAIDSGKIVVFDLGRSSIGEDAGPAVARMVVSLLLGIALRRDMKRGQKLVPCMLVVDECQNFLTPSMEKILTEARKYQLFLTLGQQMAGYMMTREMQQLVFTNCNLQFTGGAPGSSKHTNSEMLGVSRDEVRMLDTAEFYTRATRRSPTFKFRARSDVAKNANSMDKYAWRRTISRQLRWHYRDVIDSTSNDHTADQPGASYDEKPRRRRRKIV